MSSSREDRIRERADNSGKRTAVRMGAISRFGTSGGLVGMEENPDAGLLPNPSTKDPALIGVEEADIQENYGGIPGRLPTRATVRRRR
jgi:hypothetical protein